MKSRFSAFTIVELLVSMVIASLLLTFVWNVYFFLKDYQDLIQIKASESIQLKKTHYLINKDLLEADFCTLDENELIIVLGYDTIDYQLSKSYFIRNQGIQTDTLMFSLHVSLRNEELYHVILANHRAEEYSFWVKPIRSSIQKVNERRSNEGS